MQADLPNFQEDVPTRKCFSIACTNTWNSHCQLQTDEPFSNHSQMSLETIKIERLYKTQLDQQEKDSCKQQAWLNVHCLLIATNLCKKLTYKIWKLWMLASEAYYLGQDTFIGWSV